MTQLLIDTNIVLDLLAERKPFYIDAAELFSLGDKGRISLSVSALTIINTHYILRKFKSEPEARKIIRMFKVLVNVLPLNDRITELALSSDFGDFEDAIQYFSAFESKLDIIVTRNQSDYKNSSLPVMPPREYIESIQ